MAKNASFLDIVQNKTTRGERSFAERLEHKLDDDCFYWHNLPVGPRWRSPDFIILLPSRGILVLEVKDWSLDTIDNMTPDCVLLKTKHGLKTTLHPFKQALLYVHTITDLLEEEDCLREAEGAYQGNLSIPYAYGVVFTNISREPCEARYPFEVLNPRFVIYKEEMDQDVAPEAFQERLRAMFTCEFGCPLTPAQIEAITKKLYPIAHVNTESDTAHANFTESALLRGLERQQEQLLQRLGAGLMPILEDAIQNALRAYLTAEQGSNGDAPASMLEAQTENGQERVQDEGSKWCETHQVWMQLRHKGDDSWYSHEVTTDEKRSWCRGG